MKNEMEYCIERVQSMIIRFYQRSNIIIRSNEARSFII